MTLTVVRALGLITIQDLGRPGHMHEALPPGGALVRGALIAANRAAGNSDSAAAVEILGRLVVRAESDILVAIDTPHLLGAASAQLLRAGSELTISSEPRRAAYLALAGGVAAPLLLGGRGAHLSAGIGQLLRAGDALSPASSTPPLSSHVGAPSSLPPSPPDSRLLPIIRVIAGPDLAAFTDAALEALTSAPYRILPTSDRVGTRLAGPVLPRRPEHLERSRPMVRGALEVPRDGAPIVLGPEHPTTGGYPIVAVIRHADLDPFFATRPGGEVRFALA